MFKSAALQDFWLTWYLQPSQFDNLGEEFLCERLIEDVADGRPSVAFAIMECKIPDMLGHRAGHTVGVKFRIICTQDMARELIELGFKMNDRDEPDEDDGTTWSEFMSLFNHLTRDQKLLPHWDRPMRLTDDNDPHAPWFRVTGIKHDDDGPFVAIEEIEV
jgi:hypothetical protein